jgi:hypothetical protein
MLGLLAHMQKQQSMYKVDEPLQKLNPLHLAVDQEPAKAAHPRRKNNKAGAFKEQDDVVSSA